MIPDITMAGPDESIGEMPVTWCMFCGHQPKNGDIYLEPTFCPKCGTMMMITASTDVYVLWCKEVMAGKN